MGWLFGEKLASKITHQNEMKWLLLVLSSLRISAAPQWSLISDSWATTVLSLSLTNKQVLQVLRSENQSVENDRVLALSFLRSTSDKVLSSAEDPASVQADRISNGLTAAVVVVQTFKSDTDKDYLLAEMLILAHHPSLTDKLLWVNLCQRAHRDPLDVVSANVVNLLDRIITNLQFTATSPPTILTQAAMQAISTLAFVSPEFVIPRFVTQFQSDIRSRLVQIDPEAARLWKDSQDKIAEQKAPDTNVSTNEFSYIMTVTNPNKGLTKLLGAKDTTKALKVFKEEQKRTQEKFEHERQILILVEQELVLVRRGLNIIRSLDEPHIQADLWFAQAMSCIIVDILGTSEKLITSDAPEVLLSLSQHATAFGSDARFIGLATLESFSNSTATQKRDIINRVLYKLRYQSEQVAFDFPTCAYALALVTRVLYANDFKRHSGITGCQNDDDIEEQTFLVLEVLSRNMILFADRKLDRIRIVDSLICVIECRPSQNSEAKEQLRDLFLAMASDASEDELSTISAFFCSENFNVRNATLSTCEVFDFGFSKFSPNLWLAVHDESEANAELAKVLFTDNGMSIVEETRSLTIPYLTSTSAFKRECAGRALASTFDAFPDGMSTLLRQLQSLYSDSIAVAPIEYDRFGQEIVRAQVGDKTAGSRQIITKTMGQLSALSIFEQSHAVEVADFFFRTTAAGFCPAADEASVVRAAVLEAGLKIISLQGSTAVESLLPIFEAALQADGRSDRADWTREAGIILYGATASHLAAEDARIPDIIKRLLATLSTPSEAVQFAIAQCLPLLVKKDPLSHDDSIRSMLSQLSKGTTYAERRGAAFGLSGLIQGCGITSLRRLRVMETLEAAIRNKQDVKARQGALFAYECFAQLTGPLWEPYVEGVIPLLLLAFADTDAGVRTSTQDTAKAIMSRISGFGVRSILPSLLSGLNDTQWRSKKGSVELIGAMAYCAPRQLAHALPTVIPRLNEVLTDSHAQVRAAGNASLTRFGEVINNPEIQSLVPVLMKALSDPIKYTEAALDRLLKTSFLHYIDPPSLSILVPILERGLQERSATTKKKSSKIFGLLATLTAPSDLIPHLNFLVPYLRLVLVDTVPDCRATAAKALGSLVGTLGERSFPSLIDDFLTILNSDVASTDRQGAAQGLSEVLAGLGLERLEDTLPQILKDARSRYAYVREGFISLLIYLPATFGTRFAPYLAKSTVPILAGLADESEFVRDASLRAGKIMIANYVERSVELMLPELERGLCNDSWRIRVSSLQLIGDLLFKISGIESKSKQDEGDEEDDAVATEAQRNKLLAALGQARRDRVFSIIYIARFDGFAMVRSSAINVWKVLVANTPKTLKDILSTLVETIISNLAIDDRDKRAVYVDCLGDLMRKMGRDLLTKLLPAFEDGLRSTDADRIGVCVAISEVIQSCTIEQITELEDRLVSAIKIVLIDHNPEVRLAAQGAFDSLQTQFGPRIIDQILPDLLSLLQSEDTAEDALDALKGLMQARAHQILPILLPGLLQRPMSDFRLQAVASLARVAGQALVKRLPLLLTTIVDVEIHDCVTEASTAFETILLSVPEGAESIVTVMNVLLDLVKNDDHRKRQRTLKHLAALFRETRLDYSRYLADWLRVLLTHFADSSPEVVLASWQALDALTKALRKEEMASLVGQTRRIIQTTCVSGYDLPGFSLPKGLSAILPLFLQSLLYGDADQKEEAASGLGDIVQRTDAVSLRSYVTQITGPLIRIMGERSGPEVKSAILSTLRLLLTKIPAALKPFLPQLQRTFTKSLADPNKSVRSHAAVALGSLISLQTTRVDSLITELVAGAKSLDNDTSLAMLSALEQVVSQVPTIGTTSQESIISLIRTLSVGDSSESASRAAELLGVLFKTLENSTHAKSLLADTVFIDPPTDFAVTALNGLLLNSAAKITEVHAVPEVAQYLTKHILSDKPTVAEWSIYATGKFLLNDQFNSHFNLNQGLIHSLTTCIKTMPSNSSDTQRLALVVLRAVSKNTDNIIRPMIDQVGLVVVGCVRSTILPVKLAAESAFVAVFNMTSQDPNELLQPFLKKLPPVEARRISEYSQRVASRVAAAENERIQAGVETRDDDMEEIMGSGKLAQSDPVES